MMHKFLAQIKKKLYTEANTTSKQVSLFLGWPWSWRDPGVVTDGGGILFLLLFSQNTLTWEGWRVYNHRAFSSLFFQYVLSLQILEQVVLS